MSKQDDLLFNMYNHVNIVSSVECSKCLLQEDYSIPPDDMAEWLITNGWDATEEEIFCPNCNPKNQHPKSHE